MHALFFIGKKFPTTVATVKCRIDHSNCGNSYKCLTLMDESHFILLHTAVKLKKLFSVRKAIFKTVSSCAAFLSAS